MAETKRCTHKDDKGIACSGTMTLQKDLQQPDHGVGTGSSSSPGSFPRSFTYDAWVCGVNTDHCDRVEGPAE